jgi:hypothetical protein
LQLDTLVVGQYYTLVKNILVQNIDKLIVHDVQHRMTFCDGGTLAAADYHFQTFLQRMVPTELYCELHVKPYDLVWLLRPSFILNRHWST